MESTSPLVIRPGRGKQDLAAPEALPALSGIEKGILQNNVKNTLPAEATSELNKAIHRDNLPQLQILVELGQFDTDTSCPVAQFMAATSDIGLTGMQHILYMCVDHSAPRCLLFLMKWARQKHVPFLYNDEDVIDYAEDAAFGPDDNVACTMMLAKTRLFDEDRREDLHEDLLYAAQSGNLLREVMVEIHEPSYSPRMLRTIKTVLSNACRDPDAQPSLLLGLVREIYRPKKELNEVLRSGFADYRHTPLSEASRCLNTVAMELLIHYGANPAPLGCVNGHPDDLRLVPLYNVLGREFYMPVPTRREEDEDEHKTGFTYDNDGELYDDVIKTSTHMLRAVVILEKAFSKIRGLQERPQFLDMYFRAVEIFADTVCVFLVNKIRRHLPFRVQRTLIQPVVAQETPADEEEEEEEEEDDGEPADESSDQQQSSDDNKQSSDEEGEEVVEYKWVEGLTARKLQDALEPHKLNMQLEDAFLHVWQHLLLPEVLDHVQDVITDKKPDAPVNKHEDLFYGYLLLDPSERSVNYSFDNPQNLWDLRH